LRYNLIATSTDAYLFLGIYEVIGMSKLTSYRRDFPNTNHIQNYDSNYINVSHLLYLSWLWCKPEVNVSLDTEIEQLLTLSLHR